MDERCVLVLLSWPTDNGPTIIGNFFEANGLGEHAVYEPKPSPDILKLKFKISVIIKALENINVKKASGPDNFPCWVLEEAARVHPIY